MAEQKIALSETDRELIKSGVKWVRFFSIAYLGLWITMCILLFIILLAVGSRI